jgi:hypothetical protein
LAACRGKAHFASAEAQAPRQGSSMLNDITKLRKFKIGSSLKPKPFQRTGVKSIFELTLASALPLASQKPDVI